MVRLVVLSVLATTSSGAVLAQERSLLSNLGIAVGDTRLSDSWVVTELLEFPQGQDVNGDGDVDDRIVHVVNLASGELRSLQLSGDAGISGEWAVVRVRESVEQIDLNGDGDTLDDIVHVHNLRTATTTNLERDGDVVAFSETWLAIERNEPLRGMDLNDDGDTNDSEFVVYDLSTTTVRLARDGSVAGHSGKWLAFWVDEQLQGNDLNRDGDTEDAVLHVHDLDDGETVNLGLSGSAVTVVGDALVMSVSEVRQNADLNGDGDIEGGVFHVHRLDTGMTRNLEVSGLDDSALSERRAALRVLESSHGDLNGDGDANDRILHLYDLATDTVRNLAIAGTPVALSSSRLVYWADEGAQSTDFNGDGDRDDDVLQSFVFETGAVESPGFTGSVRFSHPWLAAQVVEEEVGVDLNGDLDTADTVAHLFDLESGEIINLGAAGARVLGVSDAWLALALSENESRRDLNGDGDAVDEILHSGSLEAVRAVPRFLRGDCNSDGSIGGGITDSLFYLNWAFAGGLEPACRAACDVNADGEVGRSVSDAIYYLDWIFRSGHPPPAPFPRCGRSLRALDTELSCNQQPDCL